MAELSKAHFISEFGESLLREQAAVFAGAGLSVAAGLVDWKGLMRRIAGSLGLEVDRENDLVAVAQYHQNERRSRAQLNEMLIDRFPHESEPTRNHRLLARLPIHTVWTTNYDTLIEKAFVLERKRVDVKVEPESLAFSRPGVDVTVYKMHGDVSSPQNAILTKDDYETYSQTRDLFTIRLKGDLVSLRFLGFSFTDPNIEHILSRIRALLGKNTPNHYCIMRRPKRAAGIAGSAQADYEYECRKLALRVGDLQRYGIQTVLVDEFEEITTILQGLCELAFLKSIFVSGSAAVGSDEFPLERLMKLSRLIGKEIIKRNYNLVSGYGWGVGSEVIVGAMEAADESFSNLRDRLILRPFPRTIEEARKAEAYRRWRESMLALAGFGVFIAGNKQDRNGAGITLGDGVRQEFEIGTTPPLHCIPIPIGCTGYVAKEIWDTVQRDPERYYGKVDVAEPLRMLGDASNSNEQLAAAVFDVVDRCASARGLVI
jgi:hypothetical protein